MGKTERERNTHAHRCQSVEFDSTEKRKLNLIKKEKFKRKSGKGYEDK